MSLSPAQSHLFDTCFPFAPTLHARVAPAALPLEGSVAAPGSERGGGGGGGGAPPLPPSRGPQRSAADVNLVHGHLEDTNDVTELMRTSGFSRRQLYGLWLQFKSLCLLSTSVEGVDVDTFRRFVPSMALEDPAFAVRVFAVLDRSCRRLITWSEFIECMVSLDSGTLEQRASFLFRCYDRSGSGELGLDDFFEFYCWSGGLDVPAGWSGPAALAAAQAAAAAAAERSKGAEGYEEGDSEGVALLETIEDPREAMLLTMYEFAEKIFSSLDAGGRGRVTLEGATQALRALQERLGGGALASKDLAGVFGRAMVTTTESDVSATVLASFAKVKDEQLAQRVEAQRKHAKQVGELLSTVARAEADATARAATARAAATVGRKKK